MARYTQLCGSAQADAARLDPLGRAPEELVRHASRRDGHNDWQCASLGNGSRDVAYAISTSLGVEKRRLWERELLEYYADRLAASGGPRPDPTDLFLRYRQQLFAALAWWTGTLGQPPDAPKMQPPETSREFIRRMAIAIDDLDALDSL